MSLLPLAVFVATYAAIAVGRIPGLALDRTGFALLGALAFLGLGTVSLADAKDSIDAPTIALLFGMMVLSALYQQSGLYRRIGDRLARSRSPRRLLAATLGAAAALSAVLTNDVVCFAMTLVPRVPRLAPSPHPAPPAALEAVPFERGSAWKALALTAGALVLFFTPVPAHLTALGVAAVVLTSRRMYTRATLALVDWHLLALFCGLFVVNRGLEASGWTAWLLRSIESAGVDLASGAVLVPAVAGLGLLVGNVPATMLLLPLVPHRFEVGYAIALASTFAGNAVLFGSIANLIVAERAAQHGVRLGFREHLRLALPVTLVSLVLAALAMALW